MEISLAIHCGTDGVHSLTVDDMVITNWTGAIVDDDCGAMTMVILTIMSETLQWRANWRDKPSYDEFQDIHDGLSPTPAIFANR